MFKIKTIQKHVIIMRICVLYAVGGLEEIFFLSIACRIEKSCIFAAEIERFNEVTCVVYD